jgi:hypothetical protein
MKVIRKYTAIQLGTEKTNDYVKVVLGYGEITGPYYDETYPTEEFDTEDEAIEYAYEKDNWGRWLIVPLIKFDNLGEKNY